MIKAMYCLLMNLDTQNLLLDVFWSGERKKHAVNFSLSLKNYVSAQSSWHTENNDGNILNGPIWKLNVWGPNYCFLAHGKRSLSQHAVVERLIINLVAAWSSETTSLVVVSRFLWAVCDRKLFDCIVSLRVPWPDYQRNHCLNSGSQFLIWHFVEYLYLGQPPFVFDLPLFY